MKFRAYVKKEEGFDDVICMGVEVDKSTVVFAHGTMRSYGEELAARYRTTKQVSCPTCIKRINSLLAQTDDGQTDMSKMVWNTASPLPNIGRAILQFDLINLDWIYDEDGNVESIDIDIDKMADAIFRVIDGRRSLSIIRRTYTEGE